MKKVLCVVLVILLVFALAAAGGYGYAWYRSNHIFVEDAVYPIDAQSLDLRGQDISFDHYNAVHSQLPNCEIAWDVPFQGGKYANDTESLTVSSLSDEDMDILLTYFPKLKRLDASGCREYDRLVSLQEKLPQCQIIYQVDLGGKSFELDTAELTLENGDYDFDTLMKNLSYLPQVTTITLRMPELSQEQMEALKTAYETITFSCTVELLGQEYDTQTTVLDLSAMTSDQVAEVAEKLAMLPNLETVELMDASGQSGLTKEDVKALMAAAPGAAFHYTFDFYGETLSTDTEEVKLANIKIGDEGESEIRTALDLLTNCKRFVLDNCQVSNEVMAQIREDYRDRTKVVWRVYFGKGSTLTDVQVLRAVYDLVDDNCQNLIYCEDVRFMDIGHNEYLDAVPFVAGMPNLEYIIVSGAPIKDLTPFENCKKLKFLEIAFCEYITDLSPLASCESLEMLNIANTHAVDLSPLDDLPLTHLMARTYPSGVCRVPKEEQERFVEQHPDCWASFTGAQPYGDGWRYTEDMKDYLESYALLRQAFRYDQDPNIPNHVGWYFDESEAE